jgi:hypothetical protein
MTEPVVVELKARSKGRYRESDEVGLGKTVEVGMLEGPVNDAMPRVGNHREAGTREFVDV